MEQPQLNYAELVKTLVKSDIACKRAMTRSNHMKATYELLRDLITTHMIVTTDCKEGERLKLSHYFREQRAVSEYTPLNTFFFNYSIHAPDNDIVQVDEIETEDGRAMMILIVMKIPQGIYQFYVGALHNDVSLELINHEYDDGISRPTIKSTDFQNRAGEGYRLFFSEITIQNCELCKKYQKNIKNVKGAGIVWVSEYLIAARNVKSWIIITEVTRQSAVA